MKQKKVKIKIGKIKKTIDKTFRPDNNITRDEAMTILTRAETAHSIRNMLKASNLIEKYGH